MRMCSTCQGDELTDIIVYDENAGIVVDSVGLDETTEELIQY